MHAVMTRRHIDCGVLIALREEFEGNASFHGFEEFFDVEQQGSEGFRTFDFIDAKGNSRVGAVAVMESMSPLAAHETARDFLDIYQPTVFVNIGIAGALAPSLRLGDVVVATEVDAYDYRAKAVPSGTGSIEDFTFVWGGRHQSPTEELAKQVSGVWKSPNILNKWMKGSIDRLKSRCPSSVVHALETKQYLNDTPRIEAGQIASGNVVGASSAFRRRLLDSHARTLLAVEMESFGFLRACAKAKCKSLVIKAISDLADENKEQLDTGTGDLVRAWAMSNGLHLASTALREVLSFQEWSALEPTVGRQSTPVRTERSKLSELAIRHFKKQHKSLMVEVDKTLTSYDALFRPLIGSYRLPSDNLFTTIARQVVGSSNPYPLRINGRPGTGKTTFLTILYLALLTLSNDQQDAPIPAYVNLKRYITPERGKERGWVPRSIAEDDLALLRQIFAPDSSEPVVVLIDGIDEYTRHDDSIENEVLDLIGQCSAAKKVVGIGLNYLGHRERFTRSLRRDLDNPEAKLILEGVDVNNNEVVRQFIAAFASTYPTSMEANYLDRVLDRAKSFNLKTIDLLLVSMLFDSLTDTVRYEQAGTLSDFFQIYSESFLQTDAGNESLTDAAHLAFEYTVKPGSNIDITKCIHRRAWKLLHLHASIRDFLVAWHAVRLVRNAASGSQEAFLDDLNYVYPHDVNRFCKDIMNSTRDGQFDVVAGAKRIFREGGENARPHAVYLAGRITDQAAKTEALTWLRKVCLPEVEKIQARNDAEIAQSELLLCRTVYLSLAYLNDVNASEAYIKLLLERPQWNNVNRGFHLEYYGDIPFDPERQLSHADILNPFPQTYESLHSRVVNNVDNGKYGLLNVEIFTLYSLGQYRHTEPGRLANVVRENLLKLMPLIVKSRFVTDTVREYVKMLKVNFEEGPQFLVGRIAAKLYGLKEQLRAGWKDRSVALPRIESVAEHTMGALILGLAFLPDDNPKNWSHYNKDHVLRYVMIHDLAEAIAGDAAMRDPVQWKVAKEKERAAFRYLMMTRTYDAIANFKLYYDLWEDFESGADSNADVARDLDKLDNLVQLYIYSKRTVISEFNEWRDQLVGDITSEPGREILNIIQDYFESGSNIR
jgi:nucleoside phosphorylase/5'-deoxynucleotidase YfbR-like HD superfamily hydrolase